VFIPPCVSILSTLVFLIFRKALIHAKVLNLWSLSILPSILIPLSTLRALAIPLTAVCNDVDLSSLSLWNIAHYGVLQ
jgi:hypothetical protein